MEERWEAIEEAERAYRDTKKRVATENIGLARLKDGTELVRIGAPLRPEYAAWRYGDQLGLRRTKAIRTAILVGAAAGLATTVGSHLFGMAALGTLSLQMAVSLGGGFLNADRPKARIVDEYGIQMGMSAADALQSTFYFDHDSGVLNLNAYVRLGTYEGRHWTRLLARAAASTRFGFGYRSRVVLLENEALRALGNMLPVVNGYGGNANDVARAVSLVELVDRPDQLFYISPQKHSGLMRFVRPGGATLASIPPPLRLALEMSLHEDDERRAMEGELRELEQRWSDAEVIAGIADSMFESDGIVTGVDRLHAANRTRTLPVPESAGRPGAGATESGSQEYE